MPSERSPLPGYEILDVLGRGGFATVYRARQLAVGREVALKVDSRILSSERARQRFLREVTAAGRLSGHPHVVAVHDAGILSDGRPYMVLDLCPGGSLHDRIREHGPMPPHEVLDAGVRIADALAAAHAAGVLHRDIKPGNIMVDRYGGIALTDFGLAAMPQQEMSATRETLTPAYAPPEAFLLADPTPAGDVYSLGATLYALLRGRPPYFPEKGELGLAQIIESRSRPAPELPGVSAELNGLLRQAMAADPARRPPGAAALRDALASAGPADAARSPAPREPSEDTARPGAGAVPGGAGPEEAGPRRRRRGGRLLPLVSALAALALLGTAGAVAYQTQRPAQEDAALPPATASSPPPSPSAAGVDFGVPTTVRDCPAAAVENVDGRCVTDSECWLGMVVIAGDVSINRADCRFDHLWETFAIAPLPADGMTNDHGELAAHPDVRRLCSVEVMAESWTEDAARTDPGQWMVEVLPPTESQYADGLRVFRCVAAFESPTDTSHFGPFES